MKRLGFQLKTLFLVLWLSVHSGDGYNCPYGQNCVLEPAPPGRTPPCAQPGLTYCVHPDPYPEKIIRQLIEAGQYDISTLLSDETRDEFSQKKNELYPYEYGPNSLHHVDQISLVNDPHYQKNYNTKFHTRYNHDVFAQKTPLQPPLASDPSPYNINTFQATNFSKFGYHGYSPNGYGWNPTRNYDKKVLRQSPFTQNIFENSNYPNYESNEWYRLPGGGVSQYNRNEWWKYVSPSRSDVTIERSITFPTLTAAARRRKRNAALVEAAEKRKLTGAEALRIALGFANEDTSAERHRRQAAASNTQSLCSVRTEFITPRAALNNKGSWKYVVNMPDSMSQLVRAEICTSTACSGLCTIPPGYTSRCEQKYIQKRLVALQSTGQNLYTDVFWIPSCCQCTFTAN